MPTREVTKETRAFSTQWEIRETDGKVGFRGYAAVFDSESHGEVVRRSAFTQTLSDRDPVVFLVNHDGVPIASTDSGTCSIGVDNRGLWVDAEDLDMDNPRVQEVVSAMRRKDLNKMSFAFVDRTPREDRIDDNGVRNIRNVQLYDVSVVTFPWYPDTHAELNSAALAAVEARSKNERVKPDTAKRIRFPLINKRDLNGWTFADLYPLLWDAVEDTLNDADYWWLWICDISDTWFVYCVETIDDSTCYQADYTVTAEGVVTVSNPREVIAKTVYLTDPDAAADAAEDDVIEASSWRLEAAKFEARNFTAA